MSERCKRTSKRMSEWPSTNVWILDYSEPQWTFATELTAIMGNACPATPQLAGATTAGRATSVTSTIKILVAYNATFRKLFGYRQFESVTNLQHALNRFTWQELVDERKIGFLKRARKCDPCTSFLLKLLSFSFFFLPPPHVVFELQLCVNK